MSFPKSARRIAWETFTSIVINDPVMQREVKQFKTWTGNTRDNGKPDNRLYPYLLLVAQSEDARWVDTDTQISDILVDVTMETLGSDPGVLMDFWESLVRSFYPKDENRATAISQRLFEAGITLVTPEVPSFGVVDLEEAGNLLQGTGKIRLTYFEQLKGFP